MENDKQQQQQYIYTLEYNTAVTNSKVGLHVLTQMTSKTLLSQENKLWNNNYLYESIYM